MSNTKSIDILQELKNLIFYTNPDKQINQPKEYTINQPKEKKFRFKEISNEQNKQINNKLYETIDNNNKLVKEELNELSNKTINNEQIKEELNELSNKPFNKLMDLMNDEYELLETLVKNFQEQRNKYKEQINLFEKEIINNKKNLQELTRNLNDVDFDKKWIFIRKIIKNSTFWEYISNHKNKELWGDDTNDFYNFWFRLSKLNYDDFWKPFLLNDEYINIWLNIQKYMIEYKTENINDIIEKKN